MDATSRLRIREAYEACCRAPSDICEHLPTLRSYAQKCAHVTEMGVRTVVSSWAFAVAHPLRLVSYDVIHHPNVEPFRDLVTSAGISYEFKNENVLNAVIEPTDLLFIDTLHTRDQLLAELHLHCHRVASFILLHDTVTFGHVGEDGQPGLLEAVHLFVRSDLGWRIVDHYPNCHGLTVLARSRI